MKAAYLRTQGMRLFEARKLSRASRRAITCIGIFSSTTRTRSRFPDNFWKSVRFKLHLHWMRLRFRLLWRQFLEECSKLETTFQHWGVIGNASHWSGIQMCLRWRSLDALLCLWI